MNHHLKQRTKSLFQDYLMKNVAVIVCFRSLARCLQQKRLCVLPAKTDSAPSAPKAETPLGLQDRESLNRVPAFPLATGPTRRSVVQPRTLKETKLQDLLTPRQTAWMSSYSWIHTRENEWCLKFWLLSRFWLLSKFWLLSYEIKRIEIRVLLVLKITPVIFNI